MIIGISGKKTVGKDTIGKIIQYLTAKNEVILDINMPDRDYWINISFEDYFKYNMLEHKWKIKKFADKLKDIICLLINCTREQLEDESFKNKELGEEWWYWYMERVGGYSPIILDYLTTTKKELKSYEGLELVKPTARFLLQFIGTNLFRNQLHPEIWVNALMSEYKASETHKVPRYYDEVNKKGLAGYEGIWEYPNWIITDMRFLNEMEAVKKKGGITIRVNRNRKCENCSSNATLISTKNGNLSCPKCFNQIKEHESETALDDSTFDYEIDNNGTISELIDKIRNILIENKLIKNK